MLCAHRVTAQAQHSLASSIIMGLHILFSTGLGASGGMVILALIPPLVTGKARCVWLYLLEWLVPKGKSLPVSLPTLSSGPGMVPNTQQVLSKPALHESAVVFLVNEPHFHDHFPDAGRKPREE